MNWKSVKSASEIVLDGVTVEIEKQDAQIASVTLTSATGQKLKLALMAYNLQAYVPAPPKMKKIYVLGGKVMGLADIAPESFEQEYEAKARYEWLKAEAGYPDDEKFGLKIETREVPDDN